MSKNDDLRAMREARYARDAASRAGTPATAKAPKAAAATAAPTKASAKAKTTVRKAAPAEDAQSATALCGHRAISGRTCTREHGHSEKNHRYS